MTTLYDASIAYDAAIPYDGAEETSADNLAGYIAMLAPTRRRLPDEEEEILLAWYALEEM